ncbi:hypothetical protein XAP412_1070010 [Xanthomonas phaseoli pv. phaseoli]|uniref:Uncharacterized protein n=1 Tax=Xanthomonas campestris pv. phaseoli TaxID=317013 RepID=A0AB38DV52_XANCH|nr:hypothetical protein XAP412_1070010 [Xanthomonas phaseoli pv. phaseoli]SON76069.1 hypothetical protein XAP6984_1120010 [Xanthomonas phaseoli pv. phaseoli]SON78789.1 hypothetical protein XAP7430_1090010 [Xanthomonas phaseoli pv. phaseoli]SOO30635.1 hypothetical protein XAP6164_4600012 [Xanthomonas phaseoli pv. phaseoli]
MLVAHVAHLLLSGEGDEARPTPKRRTDRQQPKRLRAATRDGRSGYTATAAGGHTHDG